MRRHEDLFQVRKDVSILSVAVVGCVCVSALIACRERTWWILSGLSRFWSNPLQVVSVSLQPKRMLYSLWMSQFLWMFLGKKKGKTPQTVYLFYIYYRRLLIAKLSFLTVQWTRRDKTSWWWWWYLSWLKFHLGLINDSKNKITISYDKEKS